MRPLRNRWTALAAALALTALAGCTAEGGDDGDGSAAADSTTEVASELEGVENFYGEYGDFVTAMAAVQEGQVTPEDLEYPFVVQQDHVDVAGGTYVPPDYELRPPAGGDHLSAWQACTGSVYPDPIVDGNGVHSMEHGAVWLTYDPALVDGDGIALLASKIEGRDYSLMSPYPEQGVAVSLQSWGNRYQTDDLDDPMIEDYLDTYILNERFNPEPNATCSGGVTTTAP
ncbi:DUF3105 domain-containing protein [Glycomyces sp. NPDC021274]|uniref:DUF3105 domain-containing protein n=1 Tax=Glycomyces sp. NPDC021274 TaxID=3155120 RepID=UPI0033C6C3A7